MASFADRPSCVSSHNMFIQRHGGQYFGLSIAFIPGRLRPRGGCAVKCPINLDGVSRSNSSCGLVRSLAARSGHRSGFPPGLPELSEPRFGFNILDEEKSST